MVTRGSRIHISVAYVDCTAVASWKLWGVTKLGKQRVRLVETGTRCEQRAHERRQQHSIIDLIRTGQVQYIDWGQQDFSTAMDRIL